LIYLAKLTFGASNKLKTINDELRRLGHDVYLEKGDGYFYFWKGDANNGSTTQPTCRSWAA
jgi:hypothetical protein